MSNPNVVFESTLLDIIAPSSQLFTPIEIQTEDMLSCVFAITDYPSKVNMAWLSKIANIEGTTFSYHVVPSDSERLKKSIDNTVVELESRLNTSNQTAGQRTMIEKQLVDAHELLKRIVEDNERVVYLNVVIQLHAKTKEQLEQRKRQVNSVLSGESMRGRILSHQQQKALEAVSPFCKLPHDIANVASRNITIESLAAAFPFTYSGVNDGTGMLLGRDMDGGIVLVDTWKRGSDRANGNVVVLGRSGSGKSTLVKKALLNEYARGVKIVVVDVEREFTGMCDALQGERVLCGVGSTSRINPMQIRGQGEDENNKGESPFAQHIGFLRTFFKLYIKDLSTAEEAVLEECVEQVYEKFGIHEKNCLSLANDKYPHIGDLYDFIEYKMNGTKVPANQLEILDKVRIYLRSIAKGANSSLWAGHTTINLNASFVVLDIHTLLEADESIKKAQFLNVLSYIWGVISKDRTERTILCVDEAHILVDSRTPQALQFLGSVAKRCRKYETALYIVSQNLIDFLDDSIKKQGVAILENPTYRFTFALGENERQALVNIMNLSEREERILTEARRGECLAIVGNKRLNAKIEISREELKLMGSGGGR